jgi:secondary thiamine-phosphate synthase enzyme
MGYSGTREVGVTMVATKQIELLSDGRFNVMNITDTVREFVQDSGIHNGHVFVFFQHTTGAVIIGEHETGIVADIEEMFERITPFAHPYKHHIRAVDYNGHAHLRAALMQTEVGVPVVSGRLALGTYQEILVIDDQVDTEPRYILLQAMGETA